MEINDEIAELFREHAEEIEEVEGEYPNGGIVKGPILKLKLSPLRIKISNNNLAGGKAKKHRLMTDHITSLKIILKSGSVHSFK